MPEKKQETTLAMNDRQNTIVCAFTHSSPRITAHQIYDWIYDTLQLPETDIRMIQIDGPRRHVYIKFHTSERTQSVLQAINGCVEFRHDNGELSMVHVDLAGMGVRRIRLANLPPEVLAQYGEAKQVNEDSWSQAYRYPVSNGMRIAVTH
jgi:hypothetical protein